jgi:hypothetical protein
MINKSFILDYDLIQEQNLSIDEFMFLLNFYNDVDYNWNINMLNNLQEKQFIKKGQDEKIILREKAKLLIDFISIDKISSINNKKQFKRSPRALTEGIDQFVNDFRQKWKGLKPGSMGSEQACKDKLIRWMELNPKYSKEQILNAVDIYLKSLNNYTYLQQADYFIYKKEGKDEHSRLSAFIDEELIDNDDWTSQIK